MHSTVTPTSANTASHIVDNPSMVNINTNSFMVMANIRFSLIILFVFWDIFIAVIIFDRLSFIITTSEASIAESLPRLPIDIPISDKASTGASFMPSPTNDTSSFSFLVFINSSSF